jgi:hypothetical protein
MEVRGRGRVSRLDVQIRRLMAQRAFLERASALIESVPGPAIQIGYGDGTAFDHLREILRRREIFVFDRVLPDGEGAPTMAERVAGDLQESLPMAWDRFPRTAALLHLNFPVTAAPRLAAELTPLIAPLLCQGAIVVSERALELPGWQPQPPPDGVREGRHFLYRAS